MSVFSLDRRLITGPFDDDVPNCVLVDLAEGNSWKTPRKYPHHLLLENLINGVENLTSIVGFTQEDILLASKKDLVKYASKIATFVNPDKTISWSMGGLVNAFKHMICSEDEIPSDFSVGPKTMKNKYTYNACMLYKLCKTNGIETRPTMSIEDMAYRVKLLYNINSNAVHIPRQLKDHINSDKMNSGLLVEFMCSNVEDGEKYNSDESTFENLCAKYDELSDVNKLIARTTPRSHEEAVIITALKYSIDITSSSVPLLELELLDNVVKMSRKTKKYDLTKYLPVDPDFRKYYKRNPKWFSLKRTYSHKLSMVYMDSALRAFVDSEALSVDDMFDIESLVNSKTQLREALKNALYAAKISNTFYFGYHPKATNDTTPIELEDLDDDCDFNCCITHGSDEYSDNLVTYKTSELTNHFRTAKMFTNPVKINETFSLCSIRKLKLICKDIIDKDTPKRSKRVSSRLLPGFTTPMASTNPARMVLDSFASAISLPQATPKRSKRRSKNHSSLFSETQKSSFLKLLESIEAVEFEMIALTGKAEQIRDIYRNAKDEEKRQIEKSLTALLEAGMCMRGWKVSTSEDKYPLKSIDTVTPIGKQIRVDDETNGSLQNYRESFKNMNSSLRERMKSLPLVRSVFGPEKLEFKQSNTEESGFSIWDRFIIVIQGDDSNNPAACIRMTSNWFVSSAYYYMVAIGLPKPFDIMELSNIS
jgi:hypothetical protein